MKSLLATGRCLMILAAAALWATAGLLPPGARAEAAGTSTVQIKAVIWGPPPQVLPVGDDVNNHFIGLGRRTGEAVFSDGRKADYSNVFTFDARRGKGSTARGYTKMVFKDGNWLFFKWTSAVVGRDKNGSLSKGEGTIVQGTGPYKGIKGVAKFTGRQLPPDAAHPKGASESTAVLTYTLP